MKPILAVEGYSVNALTLPAALEKGTALANSHWICTREHFQLCHSPMKVIHLDKHLQEGKQEAMRHHAKTRSSSTRFNLRPRFNLDFSKDFDLGSPCPPTSQTATLWHRWKPPHLDWQLPPRTYPESCPRWGIIK